MTEEQDMIWNARLLSKLRGTDDSRAQAITAITEYLNTARRENDPCEQPLAWVQGIPVFESDDFGYGIDARHLLGARLRMRMIMEQQGTLARNMKTSTPRPAPTPISDEKYPRELGYGVRHVNGLSGSPTSFLAVGVGCHQGDIDQAQLWPDYATAEGWLRTGPWHDQGHSVVGIGEYAKGQRYWYTPDISPTQGHLVVGIGEKETGDLDVAVTGCARCGANHMFKLRFNKFHRGSNLFDAEGDGPYEYWTMCPTTNEPILLTNNVQGKYVVCYAAKPGYKSLDGYLRVFNDGMAYKDEFLCNATRFHVLKDALQAASKYINPPDEAREFAQVYCVHNEPALKIRAITTNAE